MIALLKLVPLRWWLYLAGAAAIAFFIWRDHRITTKLNTRTAELARLHADYDALRQAQDHERKISEEATINYENRIARLEAARADTPVRTVRLCRPAGPGVPTATAAAGGADEGAAGEQPGAPGPDPREGLSAGVDIGPELYAQADDNDERAAQCNALIGWIRSR